MLHLHLYGGSCAFEYMVLKVTTSRHAKKTMNSHKATFGIYREENEIKRVVRVLCSRGFPRDAIAVFLPKQNGSKDFPYGQRSSVKSGALIGAFLGGILFAIFGWIVVAGIVFGAVCGALVGIGTPESTSDRYSTYLKVGGILISVHVENEEEWKRAKEILEKTGAQDIHLLDENNGWRSVYGKTLDPLK